MKLSRLLFVLTLTIAAVACISGAVGFLLGSVASDGRHYEMMSKQDELVLRDMMKGDPAPFGELQIDYNSNGGAYFTGDLAAARKAELEARLIEAFGRRAAKKALSGIHVLPATQSTGQ